jgi:hypothetical protein
MLMRRRARAVKLPRSVGFAIAQMSSPVDSRRHEQHVDIVAEELLLEYLGDISSWPILARKRLMSASYFAS